MLFDTAIIKELPYNGLTALVEKFNTTKDTITFWYGRLENIGIHVDLPTSF